MGQSTAEQSSHDLNAAVVDELERARNRTQALLAPIPDDELQEQISPIQSPLVWDFAHIAYFEELWLLRRVGGLAPLHEAHDDVYDAFRHARAERSRLPILEPAAARAYAADVRERVLELLGRIELDPSDPLLDGGFVFGMVVQHELQHQETMLQTLGLGSHAYAPAPVALALASPHADAAVAVVGAAGHTIGAVSEPWAYDNEHAAHAVQLGAIRIDRLPVSNERFAAFVEAGGYGDDTVWSAEGRRWRDAERADAPLGWAQSDGTWSQTRFGRTEALLPSAPVEHISWWEADAFARWAGGRLPTETEWEAAAAVLEGRGRVWEWTSSFFQPYPGFRAFPYAEYSDVFFGEDYRVLRGGSWATDPVVARTTFRNWDLPERRQIFSGVRLAYDG